MTAALLRAKPPEALGRLMEAANLPTF